MKGALLNALRNICLLYTSLGGRPEYRQGVVTDNGNVILDVHGMEILDPIAMENAINAIPGVVTVGLFANRGADVALIGTPDGVKTIVK